MVSGSMQLGHHGPPNEDVDKLTKFARTRMNGDQAPSCGIAPTERPAFRS
jgi:hypothetical protein